MYRACANIILLFTVTLSASYCLADGKLIPLTAHCVEAVSAAYEIHPDVLYALALVEQGTVGQDNKGNSNGTYDIGPFQINSIHRKELMEYGVSENELRNNGCTNAEAAAWHLRNVVSVDDEAKVSDRQSYLRLIARYHSITPKYNEIYANKLGKAFDLMYKDDGRGL